MARRRAIRAAKPATRVLPPEQGDGQRSAEIARARRGPPRRRRPARGRGEACQPAATGTLPGGRDLGNAGRGAHRGEASAATGSPVWIRPAGSSTTTTSPSAVSSTRPIALSASSGSTSGSWSSAAPRRTTRPIAVPSSSVNPSARRSTTRPPTRTETADDGCRGRSGRRRSRRGAAVVGGQGVPGRGLAEAPAAGRCAGWRRRRARGGPATRTSAGKRGVTAKR